MRWKLISKTPPPLRTRVLFGEYKDGQIIYAESGWLDDVIDRPWATHWTELSSSFELGHMSA